MDGSRSYIHWLPVRPLSCSGSSTVGTIISLLWLVKICLSLPPTACLLKTEIPSNTPRRCFAWCGCCWDMLSTVAQLRRLASAVMGRSSCLAVHRLYGHNTLKGCNLTSGGRLLHASVKRWALGTGHDWRHNDPSLSRERLWVVYRRGFFKQLIQLDIAAASSLSLMWSIRLKCTGLWSSLISMAMAKNNHCTHPIHQRHADDILMYEFSSFNYFEESNSMCLSRISA